MSDYIVRIILDRPVFLSAGIRKPFTKILGLFTERSLQFFSNIITFDNLRLTLDV